MRFRDRAESDWVTLTPGKQLEFSAAPQHFHPGDRLGQLQAVDGTEEYVKLEL